MAVGKKVTGPGDRGRSFAQIDLATHEEWMHLANSQPKAGALLHGLCRLAGADQAVAASQRTLAEYMGVSQMTISRALKVLIEGNWIEKVQLGNTAQTAAYRINSRAHWTGNRGTRTHMTSFRARIIASEKEQPDSISDRAPLRKIPFIGSDEEPLFSGEGKTPPAQQGLPGVNPPEMPETDDMTERQELEQRGQQRIGFD